jgi:hypothetical protein
MYKLLQAESVVENYLHINNIHLITYYQIVAEYMCFFRTSYVNRFTTFKIALAVLK